MRRLALRFLIPALLPFLIMTAAFAGGWAIVTVNDLPEYAVSRKPVILTFTVRQHGITRLGGLKPSVRATASGHPDATAAASPTGKSGEYTATLTFPEAGAWTIRIDSGFNAIEASLLPVNVIDFGSPSPVPLSQAVRGEHLFVAKGCIGCHRNQEVAAQTLVSVGPDLTGRRFPPEHLKEFLADPNKTLKRSATLEYGQMPNLNLEDQEIAALVAFINRDRSEASTR
jgi:cytochrome c2